MSPLITKPPRSVSEAPEEYNRFIFHRRAANPSEEFVDDLIAKRIQNGVSTCLICCIDGTIIYSMSVMYASRGAFVCVCSQTCCLFSQEKNSLLREFSDKRLLVRFSFSFFPLPPFLRIIRTGINKARGSIFISLTQICSNLKVTEDC